MSNESKFVVVYGVIYLSTNIITGKCYIGQTVQKLNKRKGCHIYSSSKKFDNTYFHKSIRKYGIDNFKWEILCECSSKEELDEKEQYYIKELNTKAPNGYNLNDGGNGNSGHITSNETKQKLRKTSTGKKHTNEAKKKIGEASKGRKHSDDTIKKNRENHLGKKLSDETKKKIGEASKGNKRSTKNWKITYPNGEIKIINGLKKWCEENNFDYPNIHRKIKNNKLPDGYKIDKVEL